MHSSVLKTILLDTFTVHRDYKRMTYTKIFRMPYTFNISPKHNSARCVTSFPLCTSLRYHPGKHNTFVQRRPNVFDVGPLDQYSTNVIQMFCVYGMYNSHIITTIKVKYEQGLYGYG